MHHLAAERLEVRVLVLEPLAKDQLRLLVLDLRPLDLPARMREREGRQVLAGEEGRDSDGERKRRSAWKCISQLVRERLSDP